MSDATKKIIDANGPYRVIVDSEIEPRAVAGMIVYRCKGWDYGMANDDTRLTGIEHISVTLDAGGGYPFFTIPKRDLEMVATKEPSP